jgi:hypothetical protein
MNQQERDGLREKHKNVKNVYCSTCVNVMPNTEGMAGMSALAQPAPWPCDVIRVLDAYDALLEAWGEA